MWARVVARRLRAMNDIKELAGAFLGIFDSKPGGCAVRPRRECPGGVSLNRGPRAMRFFGSEALAYCWPSVQTRVRIFRFGNQRLLC